MRSLYLPIFIALLLRFLLLFFLYPTWHHSFLETDLAESILAGRGISAKIVGPGGETSYISTAHDMPGYAFVLVFFQWLTKSQDLNSPSSSSPSCAEKVHA